MRDGMLVRFDLRRLTNDDLTNGVERLLAGFDHAPAISTFMLDAFQNEQVRRLKNRQGETHEVDPLVLKATEWSALDLTQGLNAITALSYQACSEQLGKLVDTLVRTFTIAVGARAIVLERMINAGNAERN